MKILGRIGVDEERLMVRFLQVGRPSWLLFLFASAMIEIFLLNKSREDGLTVRQLTGRQMTGVLMLMS